MLSEATADFPAMPAAYYVFVADAHAALARALAAGATRIMDVMDMPYGDRQGGVRDPAANLWWISQRLVDGPYGPCVVAYSGRRGCHMATKKNKTQATRASATAHVAAIKDPQRRADCETLARLMSKVTGEKPVMWGPSIVGFGSYHYRYDSGREGDSCATGFAAGKGDLSIYLVAAGERQEALLAKLGRHKMGKACLKLRRLADVDLKVLEQLVADSVREVRRRYG